MFNRSSVRPSRGRIAAAATVLVVAGALSVGAATAADATTSHHAAAASHAKKPTIVFVHGAYADASGWNSEISELTKLGYPVYAPANPLRGLVSDGATIRSFLDTIKGPIVLVAHSYGGAVITNAATGDPQVKALVYVGAFLPKEGESVSQAAQPDRFTGALLGPDTLTMRAVDNPLAPGGKDTDLYITPSDFRAVFAADESKAKANQLAATQRALSLFAFTQPSGVPAWKTIPSWDLITLDDKAIDPRGQLFMAKRAGAHITTIKSAHDVLISHPAAVVSEVLKAVKAEG